LLTSSADCIHHSLIRSTLSANFTLSVDWPHLVTSLLSILLTQSTASSGNARNVFGETMSLPVTHVIQNHPMTLNFNSH